MVRLVLISPSESLWGDGALRCIGPEISFVLSDSYGVEVIEKDLIFDGLEAIVISAFTIVRWVHHSCSRTNDLSI